MYIHVHAHADTMHDNVFILAGWLLALLYLLASHLLFLDYAIIRRL